MTPAHALTLMRLRSYLLRQQVKFDHEYVSHMIEGSPDDLVDAGKLNNADRADFYAECVEAIDAALIEAGYTVRDFDEHGVNTIDMIFG
jgi:hypothetical protein